MAGRQIVHQFIAKIRSAIFHPEMMVRIDDRQSLAYGAPDGFSEMTRALLAELPRLVRYRPARFVGFSAEPGARIL